MENINYKLAAAITYNVKYCKAYTKKVSRILSKEYNAGTIRKGAADKCFTELLELRDELQSIGLKAEELCKQLNTPIKEQKL